MLELTGKCCDAITAVEFFESLAEIIPEDNRKDDFCDEYEQALNRFRYEAAKDIGAKKRIVKAAYKHHHDLMYCGKCGFCANEPSYTFCPNCGTRYIRTKNACLEF